LFVVQAPSEHATEAIEPVVPIVIAWDTEQYSRLGVAPQQHLVERHEHAVGDLLRGRHRVSRVTAEQQDFAARRVQELTCALWIRQLVGLDDEARHRAADRHVVTRVRDVVDPQVAAERLDDGALAFVATQHARDPRRELLGAVGRHPIA
jgi:hypothetical protein